MKTNEIKVGSWSMGNENDILFTQAIGSGIVICMYETKQKLGGLVHAVLPGRDPQGSGVKYVENAIDVLYQQFLEKNVDKSKMWVKVIGGAQIFRFMNKQESKDVENYYMENHNIGKRNIECCKRYLKELGIDIQAEDTGADFGRCVQFFLEGGKVIIESVRHGTYWI